MLTDIARHSSDVYHSKGFAYLAYIIGTVYNKKYNIQNPQNIFHASLARFAVKDIRNSQLDNRLLALGIYVGLCK